SGRVTQRVRSVAAAQRETFQAWLRAENAAGANVYVSLNAIAPHQRSRRRDAILAIRHVFLDADHSAPEVLDVIARRSDLPQPSYTLNSSLHKAHIFWRVAGFAPEEAEALQKQLARELGTDPAATARTQLTRLPGFLYLKSPVVRTWRTTLISQGPTYAAVTHSWKDEARPRRPRASSSLLAPV